MPDICSPVPLIHRYKKKKAQRPLPSSHMNFHNVVWLVFFLLGHLGNLIFKGNKGTGKVEEGGIIFLYIYLKNILIDFLALVSEVFHVLRLWIAFFLLSIGSASS